MEIGGGARRMGQLLHLFVARLSSSSVVVRRSSSSAVRRPLCVVLARLASPVVCVSVGGGFSEVELFAVAPFSWAPARGTANEDSQHLARAFRPEPASPILLRRAVCSAAPLRWVAISGATRAGCVKRTRSSRLAICSAQPLASSARRKLVAVAQNSAEISRNSF